VGLGTENHPSSREIPLAGQACIPAGGGNDTISARDGVRDTIDCGAGHDKATVDRRDTVKSCETVRRR
jgi:hypothetical protein